MMRVISNFFLQPPRQACSRTPRRRTNPAVAIAQSPTNTFSGIRPADAPAFIVAQLIGAICGVGVAGWLLAQSDETDEAINPKAQL
jgi:glycerol uptake facilitator-like aquaporin